MEAYENKRQYERHDYSSPMSLYLTDDLDQSCFAQMKDYSQGGVSLFTDEQFHVGHKVYLK